MPVVDPLDTKIPGEVGFSSNGLNINNSFGNTEYKYNRGIHRLIDTNISADRDATTTWKPGATFSNITGFKANSLLRIYYSVPCRNGSLGWGGLYFEPQISFNGGSTWQSLGSRGFDAVMTQGGGSIHASDNLMLIDPGQSSDFSVRMRYYFRSYDGTVIINDSRDINAISGTATRMSGDNGNQHFTHFIIEEIAIAL
jgi:hypothetical protein